MTNKYSKDVFDFSYLNKRAKNFISIFLNSQYFFKRRFLDH